MAQSTTARLGLLAAALGLAAGLLAARGADAQTPAPGRPTPAPAPGAERTLTIATLAPAGSTWMQAFDAWGREVRRRSQKRLSLRFYPGGVQGDEGEVVRKIRSGRLDGAGITAVGLGQIVPSALVFQMPGLFAGYTQLDNARRGMNTEMSAAFESAGFTLMGWADVGLTHPFSENPIHVPTDLASAHPWGWREDTVTAAFLDVVGAHGVPLAVPEVQGALSTGRVNAFVSSPVATLALQWTTHIHHMTQVDCAISIGATVFGRRQFDALPPEDQTILRETATQFHNLLVRNLRRDEATAITTLAGQGIAPVPVTPAQQALWTTAFAATRARLVGHIADQAFVGRVTAAATGGH